MNCYSVQQNAIAALEEMRGNVTICDHKGPVICPKPRRVGGVLLSPNMPARPLRCHQLSKGSDSEAGEELLGMILKESYGEEQYANQEASSPPFFLGSPPVRAPNPLVQDAQFGHGKHSTPPSAFAISSSSSSSSSPSNLVSPSSASSGLSSPSSALRKGGCVRTKLGIKSAVVRVEGFDCHVPAVA